MPGRKQTLKDIREDKGRTIRDLAQFIDVDRGTIHRLEKGFYRSHSINRETLRRLYTFYGPKIYGYVRDHEAA